MKNGFGKGKENQLTSFNNNQIKKYSISIPPRKMMQQSIHTSRFGEEKKYSKAALELGVDIRKYQMRKRSQGKNDEYDGFKKILSQGSASIDTNG